MNDALLSRRQMLCAAGGLLAGVAASGLFPSRAAEARKLTRNTDIVRIGWGYGSLPDIAKQRGVFEQTLSAKGIKVEWIGPFPSHAPSNQAVVGGSADFGFWGLTTPALAAMLAGSPIVFTAFDIYSPRSTAIIMKKSSGIRSVADLVGRKVAVNRSGLGEFLLIAALEKHRIDRDKQAEGRVPAPYPPKLVLRDFRAIMSGPRGGNNDEMRLANSRGLTGSSLNTTTRSKPFKAQALISELAVEAPIQHEVMWAERLPSPSRPPSPSDFANTSSCSSM